MKINKNLIALALITLFAAVLRLYNLTGNPPSLNWDEVSHGYNAYSILQTGRDEWGIKFPLIFRAFGDYKLPVYIYLTVIAEAILGLNTISVRLVSVVAGILAIPGIYLLVNELIKKKDSPPSISPGLLAAFFLSVLPWHFFISRPALEANLCLTLIIFGFYFLLRSYRTNNYLLPALLLGLSLHTYNSARIFVPLLIIVSLLIYRPKFRLSPVNYLSLATIAVAILIIVFQVVSGSGTARYDKLKILSESAVYDLGQQRLKSNLPSPLPRLVYNRPVYFVTEVGKHYLSYFTPKFFYQSSGAQTQFAIPNHNLITLPLLPLSFIGLIFLLRNWNHKQNLFILSWLLLSPLAASLTASPPQALRPTPMIPVLVTIAVLGFIGLERWLTRLTKKPVAVPLVFSLLLISFSLYLRDYHSLYPQKYSQSWQYGYDQIFNSDVVKNGSYDRLFISKWQGEPHIFYAFFTKLDPSVFQNSDETIKFYQDGWYWVDRVNNTFFVNDKDIPNGEIVNTLVLESGGQIPVSNSLLVTSSDNLPGNATPLETINFLDGSPAFVIAKFPNLP